ncbi:tapemeasure protein [Mycobacterium phage Jabiru]|nr:tapemeasure protein [Mycobacterium phage Jabiru]
MAKGKGAGGTEVGRIYIRVVPDADGFHGNLRRQLQGADKDVEVEVKPTGLENVRKKARDASKGLEAEVQLNADTTKATRQLDLFQKRQTKDLNKFLTQLEAKIPLTAEGERFRRQIERAARELENEIKADIPVEASLAAGQRAKVLGEVQAVKKLAERDAIQLKLDPTFDYKLHNRLVDLTKKRAEAELKAEQDYDKRLKSYHDQLYANKHKQRIADFKEELRLMKMREDETRKFVADYKKANPPIQLRLDPEFDFKLRQRLAKIKPKVEVDLDVKKGAFSRIATSLGKLKAPSFGSGINPSGYALIIAGLAALSPLIAGTLGAITTGLLSIPGLIAAVAVPIGALTLGVEGLSRAAEVLKAPFEDLKQSMSAKVQEQFTPVFEKLRDIFPTLKDTLPAVTNGLSAIAQAVVNTVTGEGLERIKNTITNIADALTKSAPGIGNFTNGLLGLVENFSKKMPDIAGWINTTGKSFSEWVTKFTTEGPDGTSQFDRALQSLGDTLKTLGGGLVELGGKALDFFSDPEKVQSFKAELDGVVNTVLTLVDAINGISSALSKVPGLSDGSADSVFDFAPIQLQLLKDAFGKIDFSGIWNTLKTGAQTAWSQVTTLVQTSVANISSIVRGIGPVTTGIWNGITSSASSAWNGVVASVRTSWESIKTAVSSGVDAVLSYVSGMGGRIISAITSIDLSGAGRALMDGLLAGIRAGAQAVYDFVSGIAGRIAQLKGPLPYDRQVLIPNGQALMDGLGMGLATGFEDVLARAKSMAEQISEAITDGISLDSLLGGTKLPELQKMLDTLEEQRKVLKVQKNNTTDKSQRQILTDQMSQLQAQKDQLSLIKDQYLNTNKYGTEVQSVTEMWDQMFQKMFDMPFNFAKATGGQLLSDLGIGGGGALTTLAEGLIDWGINAGKKFIFNVNSVDEALSAHRNLVNREALQFTR